MIQWTKLLTLILIITTIFTAVALSLPVIVRDINLGIDLQGGVYVLLEAQVPEGDEQETEAEETSQEDNKNLWQKITAWFDGLFGGKEEEETREISNEDMIATIAVLRNRVDSFGLSEPVIQREGERRIRIELATDPNNPEQGQQAILETIGKTALLEFKDSSGKTVLTGANLTEPRPSIRPMNLAARFPWSPGLDSAGAKIFELTASHLGQQIPFIDGEVIRPTVQTVIADASLLALKPESFQVANLFQPCPGLEQLEVRTVGPTLGAIPRVSLWAGLRPGPGTVFMIIFTACPTYCLPCPAAYGVILLDLLVR